MGKLYIVPTPIGNLDDMTLRAIKVLQAVDLILAEDTRTSSKLLHHFEIQKKVFSHHKFNEHKTVEHLAQRMAGGETIALISDAGTPAISDPGYLLVRACIDAEVEVECLPGATALIPALVNSGLPNDRFCFEGFLPPKKGRQKKLLQLAEEERTLVFYESPYKLVRSLEQFAEFFGADRQASVSRELTKIYEETQRGTVTELANYFKSKPVKGEIVIVVAGKKEKASPNRSEENQEHNE
ncbi:16S rRNA (cytidine(1402)-2'-O)-methyltransferase [uncultured Sunxiuqinia sp.]|uniref:16S rRNA (cytidine(1402)-2'-O)-methyltransferase n=1 Tax=uncultured Sunxiuqinia sp. TaxID=1573825 RepID=UPI0030D6F353|tara:strand:+ start:36201 stop:36920 length:720 start_codon:yes stop_codon:yes gene_type:complete